MKPQSRKKSLLTVIKFLVSGALVCWLLVFVDWSEVWILVTSASIFYILLFIFFYLMGIFLSSAKWQVLGERKGFGQPLWFYTKTYLIGTFLNNFFPSFVGGDTYRTVALADTKETTPGKKDLAGASQTVIADRISGLHAILLLGALSSIVLIPQAENNLTILLILIGTWGGAFALSLLLGYFDHPIIGKLISIFPNKVSDYIQKFESFRRSDVALRAYGYSFLFVLFAIAIENYMLFLAVGAELSFWNYLSVVFVISIVASIPVSIGNIGVKEWAYIFFFGLFGISASVAVTVVLLSRFLQMLISLTAIPLYLSSRKSS